MSPTNRWALGALAVGLVASIALAQADNERSTICKPGYAKSRRLPPRQYYPIRDEAFRRAGVPVTEQCHEDDPMHHDCWVLDHISPLELGGTWDFDNLQVQPYEESRLKDQLENSVTRAYCRGEISLEQARAKFGRTHR